MAMNPEQANSIADQLIKQAEAKREPALERVARRKATFARFVTALSAIVGYYFGKKLAPDLTANPLVQEGIAVVFGLLVALIWPPRRQA